MEPEDHYCVHKNPPLDPILIQLNPYIFKSYCSLRSTSILSSQLCLVSTSDYLPSLNVLPVNSVFVTGKVQHTKIFINY
jgi:hypothetical protein